ncbi:hypothetical protein MANES_07G080900v8 [Manihot esculenta]|uniref:Uncharacterized protein n=1 Tax=Manihot esculenta TaxID=3983 RepID=A0ACB7HDQ8_MANES|nr:hypothetical protein MANES_07G080900v8 [Manihot esculenta]
MAVPVDSFWARVFSLVSGTECDPSVAESVCRFSSVTVEGRYLPLDFEVLDLTVWTSIEGWIGFCSWYYLGRLRQGSQILRIGWICETCLPISYNSGPRPFKDIPFLILFALCVLCTFAFGIFSVSHRNPDYTNLSSFTYEFNSTSCAKDSLSSSSVWFLETHVYYYLLSLWSSGFWEALIWNLVVTFILSAPICFLFLLLLKHYTKQIVYISLPFFIVLPIFFNIYWFVAYTVSSTCIDAFPLVYRILVLVFVFLVIGVIMWILVANWHRIDLTVMIIGVASDALSKNLALLVALPLLTFGLVFYYAPIVVFLVFARLNGKIVPKESSGEYTCVWKQDSWVPAYYALAILAMLWSLTTMVETQVYVINGTIAQWYFTKEDSSPKRGIRSSLR